MNAFRASLERTGLGAPLDVTQNVTCLTPNDTAYALAGFPNATADIFSLSDLTKLHILTQPLYSNFLEDGQELLTFSNQTVRVRIDGEDIYIGGAKIINPNVMTNNGLMHVIDRVSDCSQQRVAKINGRVVHGSGNQLYYLKCQYYVDWGHWTFGATNFYRWKFRHRQRLCCKLEWSSPYEQAAIIWPSRTFGFGSGNWAAVSFSGSQSMLYDVRRRSSI